MELRTLRYFLAVAEEGNMTAAASALHVSQPALSYQISELEQELGTKLFIRHGRGLILTDEGRFLRSRAAEIIALSDQTRRDLSSGTRAVEGDIYIGAAESNSFHFLADVIASLVKTHPGIRFHIYSGTLDDVYDRLSRGTLDFALLVEPVQIENCETLYLPGSDKIGVIIRRDHPLAEKKYVRAEDLFDIPLILTVRAGMNPADIASRYGIPKEHFRLAATGNLIYNLAILASHDIGAIITLEGLISDTHPDLTFIPLQPAEERRLVFVRKEYRPLSEAGTIFLQEVKKALQREIS